MRESRPFNVPLPAASGTRGNPSLGDFSAPRDQRQTTTVGRSMLKFRDVYLEGKHFVSLVLSTFSFDSRLNDSTEVYCKFLLSLAIKFRYP